MNISHWIDGWARQAGSRTALYFEGRTISYAEFAREIHRTAAMLDSLGVRPGDRIAHLGFNSPEFLALVFAAARIGAMFVPLNWRLAPPEHDFILNDARPAVLFAEASFAAHIAKLELVRGGLRVVAMDGPVDEAESMASGAAGAREDCENPEALYESPLLLVYTSGTTGRPKGAVLTQSAVFWNAVNAQHAHDMHADDHILTNLPMFHVGGLNIQTLPALHCGARVTLQRRFEPGEALRAIAERRPTHHLMVPATIQAVFAHPDWTHTDLSCLRMIMTGSSVVPTSLIEALHGRGVPVGQVYGSTETAPIAIYLRREDAFEHVGSTGKAAVHCDLRIVGPDGREAGPGERGEILVRGPNIMSEYWRNKAATREVLREGWFHTGDIGHADADGFVFVDDRKKDMIISGGENIYPAELEDVLMASPDIAEAAVVGRPDKDWGEVAVAVVVPAKGRTLDESQVLKLFEGRLARFKHPRSVVTVDELPRNAMGKVLKFALRDRIARDPGC